jgi:23S rRNA (guanine745-N1)-methyltransferase
MVEARRRLHEAGVSAPHLDKISSLVQAGGGEIVVEVGCGEGFYLGKLSQQLDFVGYGIDISAPAIDSAAKRYRKCDWIIANADRMIPLMNRSCSTVLSVTSRLNAQEFERILTPDGRVILAVPSDEDLIELRGAGRDRASEIKQSMQDQFRLVEHDRVTHRIPLDAELIQDVLAAIYRPLQRDTKVGMSLTFSLDVFVFQRRER